MQNPLESYRCTQRELRRRFDAFTRSNCPTCPKPCCLRPARIVPADIMLAEAAGWRMRVAALESRISATHKEDSCAVPDKQNSIGSERTEIDRQLESICKDRIVDSVGPMADALMQPLAPTAGASDEAVSAIEETDPAVEALPCEYLGARGCTFPNDLRPFGCTTYICKYMYARMDRRELTRIKRLVRELDDRRQVLLKTMAGRKGGW